MMWVIINTTVSILSFMKIGEVVQKFKPGDTQIVITLLSPPVREACKLKNYLRDVMCKSQQEACLATQLY
jgi:hypothetical protein